MIEDNIKTLLDEDMYAFYNAAGEYSDNISIKEYFVEMAKHELRSAKSYTAKLLSHLIKTLCQPNRLSKSWLNTILNQHEQLIGILEDSPSLKNKIINAYSDLYTKACKDAKTDMFGAEYNEIPKDCPWELDTLLNRDFIVSFINNAIKNNKNLFFNGFII